MTDLNEILSVIDSELRRSKAVCNDHGFHNGTALNAIIRRYRHELKQYRKTVKDDLLIDGVVDYTEL